MQSIINYESMLLWLRQLRSWFFENVLIWDNLVRLTFQLAAVLIAWMIGELIGRKIRRSLQSRIHDRIWTHIYLGSFVRRFLKLIPLITAAFLLWLFVLGFGRNAYPAFLMVLVLNLWAAWIVIRLATSVILDRFWSRLIAAVAWSVAALNIVGMLDRAIALLNGIGFSVGDVRLTLLSVTKAIVVLMILFRAVRWLNAYLERKLREFSDLTPSSRVLLGKIINISLLVMVTLIGLNSVGIDLTALAVFSGAVGVGVGFGLQKVVGNFISGIILLSDKSVKPGDVIQVEDVYGQVRQMGGRCVSVVTRDEKEYLIPNEDLITQQVINWSYSSNKIRIKAPFGISYNADPHLAIERVLKSIRGIDRILIDPPPVCLLVGFGDSSVDLELRFWIEDPQNGVANITSKVLLKVWDTLKENKIEIPFPQRDVHLDLSEPVRVVNVDKIVE